jgi:hypothetical protein
MTTGSGGGADERPLAPLPFPVLPFPVLPFPVLPFPVLPFPVLAFPVRPFAVAGLRPVPLVLFFFGAGLFCTERG